MRIVKIILTIIIISIASLGGMIIYQNIETSSIPSKSEKPVQVHMTASTKVPSFVEALLDSTNWVFIETFSQANNQTYRYTYDFYNRTSLIYNDDRILLEDPTLFAYSISRDEKYRMHIGIAGKTMLVDTRDSSSLAKLAPLNKTLDSFQRFKKDHWLDSIHSILHHFSVDFPTPSISHNNEINTWIVNKVNQSTNEHVETEQYKYIYKGEKIEPASLAQFAADRYFDLVHHEYANSEELPHYLHMNFNLRARILTHQFVTFQQTIHSHGGGAHGYFTEKLISYDFINKQEIDCEYLFKPQYKKDIEKLFIDCVCNDLKFAYMENANDRNAVIEKFSMRDENNNPSGELILPQPGLTKEGIVFSFQPYDISSYAAGTFHFIIPYENVKPFLTEKGKLCIGTISLCKD